MIHCNWVNPGTALSRGGSRLSRPSSGLKELSEPWGGHPQMPCPQRITRNSAPDSRVSAPFSFGVSGNFAVLEGTSEGLGKAQWTAWISLESVVGIGWVVSGFQHVSTMVFVAWPSPPPPTTPAAPSAAVGSAGPGVWPRNRLRLPRDFIVKICVKWSKDWKTANMIYNDICIYRTSATLSEKWKMWKKAERKNLANPLYNKMILKKMQVQHAWHLYRWV
jgi:hypothetical protein